VPYVQSFYNMDSAQVKPEQIFAYERGIR
jgi:hypothetical protein